MTRNASVPRHDYWAILSFYLFFKALGLATFSIRNVTSRKNLSAIFFIGTAKGILYNLLLCCLAFGLNYLTVPCVYHREYFNKSVITVVIEVCQTVLGSLMTCTIILYYCAKQSSLVRIGNYLIGIEKELHRWQHAWRRGNILVTLLAVYSIHAVLLVALVYTDYLAFDTELTSWMADFMPQAFAGWLLLQYFSATIVTTTMFCHVNNAVQSICRGRSVYARAESFSRTRRVFVSTSKVQFLLHLRDIHDHLCVVCGELSDFYSVPALFCISYFFSALVYNSYYLLEPLVVDNVTMDVVTFLNTVFNIAFLLLPLGLLFNKTTETVDEIEKTGNFVHALLHCAIDKETRRELKEFSLQLLHRKIRFSAKGYFSLDNTFFQSMLGAVATYLVILIQFEMGTSSQHSCHCNCTHHGQMKGRSRVDTIRST